MEKCGVILRFMLLFNYLDENVTDLSIFLYLLDEKANEKLHTYLFNIGGNMNKKVRIIILILFIWSVFAGYSPVQAKTNDIIHFNDKKLEEALRNKYYFDGPITKEKAHELSSDDTYISLWGKDITDLEGIQYFDGLTQIDLSFNGISNLQPLSKLPNLYSLDISCSSIKGKELENTLNNMGKLDNLDTFKCYNNEIEDITFLQNIGNIDNYIELELSFNHINNISILNKSKNLNYLNLINNRISDLTPVKNIKGDDLNVFLYDNCMIDLKPIKPLFDRMFTDRCGGDLTDRFDFYKNPVNIIYQNQELQFPHMTMYYMFQAYTEAIPLIEALGGSAVYDKSTGTLICRIYDKELIMRDFSNIYTLNGINKRMPYEMRRMQYDTAYVPIKDLCNILGLNYHVLKERSLFTGDSEIPEYAPEIVKISVFELSDRTEDYKFEITDNQVGIIKYLGTNPNVIIPSQINGLPVTYLEEGAFCDDVNLVSVEIPDTVIRIGTAWGEAGVFTGCDNLVSVKLNEGKEAASIGSVAFSGCSKLTDITIPGNYKVIYDSAFNNCSSLEVVIISEGVERIGAGAFAGDEALVSVTIPTTIRALGYEYDEDITTDPYYINQTGVFSFCSNLKQVNLLKGETNAYIGANTFSECSKLESIIIPGNYKAIYNNAFYKCERLKSFVYEKSSLKVAAYQIIDQNAFEGCKRLEEVLLLESLRSIGDNAFIDCTKLKEIVIPEGVTQIGDFAFSGTPLESVTLPSTVIVIGSSVDASYGAGGTFYGCKNLVDVLIKEGNENAVLGASTFQGCTKLDKIIIPGNYVTIGEEAFSACTALKSVSYHSNSNPNVKQIILTNAFQGCKNLAAAELPSTLTLLEYQAFGQCTKLKTVTIPTGINKLYIKDFVFADCPSLSGIYVGENVSCSDYGFSLSNSKAKIYTTNKAVKEQLEWEELEAFSPAPEYVNGTTLFGTVDILGAKEVGSLLTADIDAVTPIGGSFTYKWTINGKTVSVESTYEIKKDDKGKSIKLTVTGDKEFAGSLSRTISILSDSKNISTDITTGSNTDLYSDSTGEIINYIRYDGYYYNYDETEMYIELVKFFKDGKVTVFTTKMEDFSIFTDLDKREEYFASIKKWFDYNFDESYGHYTIKNGLFGDY